jgi:uncharacterized membrane protein
MSRHCSNCGREESSKEAKFCVRCGAELPDLAAESAPIATEDDQHRAVAELQSQVARLQSQMNRQAQRIFVLESTRADSAPAAAPTDSAETTGAPAAALPDPREVASTRLAKPTSAPREAGGEISSAKNWEWLLGGNWLARIGILALTVGVGFFLKLAFDNDWIGETGRVVLGFSAGFLLLVGGEFWSRRYPAWAQAVTGGGVAVLYLSVFAAYVLYDLFAPIPALGLASLVTAAAAGLSIRYDSRSVFVLALLGGFATPLFLADSLTDQWVLLAYVVVLDLGVLALAFFRDWRWIAILAFAGSVLLFGFWHAEFEPGLALAQSGITVIFLMFLGMSNLVCLRRPGDPQPLDWALIALNPAAFLAISYGLMFNVHRPWMGGFALSLAVLYGLVGYGIGLRFPSKILLGRAFLAIGLVLLTIAVPVQFEGAWVTTIWAAEASLLVRISYMRATPHLRWAAGALFALIVFKLVILDFDDADWRDIYFGADHSYLPVVNWHFLAFAAAVAGMYRSALLIRNWRERNSHPSDGRFLRALLIAANGLTLFALSAEVVDAFDREYFAVDPDIAGQVLSLSLSGIWALYAAVLIVLGIAFRKYWLRVSGLGLLAVPVLKLFVYDAFELAQAYRVAAFIGLGVLLIAGGFLYQRFGRTIRGVLLE